MTNRNDHENRLTQSVAGGVTSSFTYNGDGLRMSHTASGQPTNYVWDAVAGLPLVLQDNTYTYVYGLDLISATDSGGNQNYYLHNGLGSVTNIVDYSGNEKALYFYDAFGNPRYAVELTSNVWRYTGEQRDADSGLYYLRARYYDSSTGRFLSQDPAGAGHPYAYVENNPVNFVDPSGLDACEDVLGWAGVDDCDDVGDIAEDVAEAVGDAACANPQFVIPCGMVGAGPLGDSYFDVNVTFGCYFVYSIGLQYSADQGFHPYYGAGVGSCGGALSGTIGPGQGISEGLNCGFQGSYLFGPFGPTGQVGGAPIKFDKEGAVMWEAIKAFWEIGGLSDSHRASLGPFPVYTS